MITSLKDFCGCPIGLQCPGIIFIYLLFVQDMLKGVNVVTFDQGTFDLREILSTASLHLRIALFS